MSKKSLLNRVAVGLLAATTLCGAFATTALAAASSGVETASAGENARANVLEWRYKTVDGKKYMRLWDATDKVWLTDWILVS